MFIRKKNINGSYYAYLVKNTWTSRGSRQKATYMGKIIQYSPVETQTPEEFMCIKFPNSSIEQIIKSIKKTNIVELLVQYELQKCGFEIQTRNSNSLLLVSKDKKYAYEKNKIYEINPKKIKKDAAINVNTDLNKSLKEVVLETNQGFICSFNNKRFIRLIPKGYDDRAKGIQFTKLLLEAGLHVTGELLVHMFMKWCEEEKTS